MVRPYRLPMTALRSAYAWRCRQSSRICSKAI
jgi:hypothetical protein